MQTITVKQKGDFYTCDIGITKEEWLAILQDKETKDSFKEALLCFYYMPGHRGSCSIVGKKMGKNASALNILISKFGSRVKKLFQDRFEVIGTDGKPTFWIIPMDNGKILNSRENGAFEWELRKELAEAIEDYLYWYLVEQYKILRREIPINQNGPDYELYKWQLITACQGKSPMEILTNHVEHSSTASLGGFANLIDATRDNKSLKHVVTEKTSDFRTLLNHLVDEERPLNERLAEFKTTMATLLPTKGYSSKANDERTAATILTCVNPNKYTFYKHDGMYDKFCTYIGKKMQKAGLCYSHYLTMLKPLSELIDKDTELQAIIKPSLSGIRKSNLLLAQDILWVLMGRYATQLGYIYNLLFNKEKEMEINNNNKINEYIKLLEANHNLILTGAPGTGKTYVAKQIAAKMLNIEDTEKLDGNAQYSFVQFHPSYDYTDFVEGLRPDGNGGFELRQGVFKEFCARAIETENDPSKKYVFVIDEINRGEISKILGELFFSIDPSYRGKTGTVQTQYQNMVAEGDVFKKGFYVPKNVNIIGTMNDIDRNVESMDFAMRRRFAWKEITAEDSKVMLDNNEILIGAPIDEIKARMTNLNAAIIGEYEYKKGGVLKDGGKKKIQGLNKSFQIGAAYFLKYANYMENDNAFDLLWEYHLKGLLAEYLRGNADTEKELKMLKEAYDNDGTNKDNGQQSGEA